MARLCSTNATLQIGLHIAVLLSDPRVASGAFAVAKDEIRDTSSETDGPLNSLERSIRRTHVLCCPRLRRMILGKSETVLITVRDTKDCFFLYEVPPSRVVRQVIGRGWLEHLDDESFDVIDTGEIESLVSQDLLETCSSVNPVSDLHCCQIGMTAIVMGYQCRKHARMCSPPTVACCTCAERTTFSVLVTPHPSHEDDWARIY